jgi:outer membrane protein TolC
LRALEAQIAAEQARLALAYKEFCPDFGPFAMYDRFMGNNPETQDLAPMVGVSMNLPVYRDKRFAALAEARAKIAQRRAELAQRTNQVHFQVQEAFAQVRESEQTVELYRKTILTAAEANVKAAEAAYVPGKIPFVSLIEAQRNQVELYDRYYQAIADYHRRRARLERVVGGPLEATRQLP